MQIDDDKIKLPEYKDVLKEEYEDINETSSVEKSFILGFFV